MLQSGAKAFKHESATWSINSLAKTWEVKSNCTIDMDTTFVEAVRTGDGSKIRSTYPDAAKSAELSIAANESLETGKVIDLSQWP